MKLETFFEKFDQFAEAPDAVAKMRELVLNLAIRGKLVVHNVTDEPAALLLKRVLAEKNRRTGRGECSDEEQGSAPAEETFEIPANWEWIGATTPAVMVSDQNKKVQTKDILESGKFPVVDQGKMFIRGYCDDFERVIRVAEPIVLFGDHTRETKFIDFDFIVGADGVKLLQPICIDPHFYFLVLRWLPLESRGYARHFKLLKAARIPLPPLAEQKRIVAKVDELMALCDQLEAQQQERNTRRAALARASLARFADAPTPANLNFLFHKSYGISPADLRKSILTLAVQGKLVPQDPNDEPAVVLMEKIAGAIGGLVDAGSVRVPKPLTAVTDNEKMFPLPAGWVWARLQEVIDVRDGTHDSPKDSTDPDAFPLVTSRNFENGDINFETTRRISAKDHFEIQKRSKVEKHDILFSMIGGNIGNQVVVKTDAQFSVKNVALFKYYDRSLTYPLFIKRYMEHLAIRLQQESVGGAQPFVSLGYFRKLPIALPPTTEQRRIVAKVDQLMALIDELETHLAASRATAKNLLEALVVELTAAGAPSRRGDA